MSEKGDMPGDTVSLPPNYAPSETFTDSPPPAYRGGKSSRVQIVKLICVTVVVSAFIIGFFIITSNYLNARACNCPQNVEIDTLKSAGFFEPPRASSLVGNEKPKLGGANELKASEFGASELGANELGASELDNDIDLGDDTTLPKIDLEVIEDVPIPPQEVEEIVEEVVEAEKAVEKAVEEELEREEEEEEALEDILSAQLDHMKKIKLPIDLILGNPALAGRNVNCEVERRQQPIGPGIMTQAIIVTCKDPRNPKASSRTPTPPMSILGPIMKMLASRSSRPLHMAQPRPVGCGPNRMCGPNFEGRMIPIGVRGPVAILGAPSLRFAPPMSPEDGPRNKMLPVKLQPVVNMAPRMPRLLAPPPQHFASPVSLASLHRGALPMPVPQPRAAKDPISLPGIRLRPSAPFLPQNINVVRAGARRIDRPITHMEMNAPPHMNAPPPHTNPPQPQPKEFGPPRIHTVLNETPMKQFRSSIIELKPSDQIIREISNNGPVSISKNGPISENGPKMFPFGPEFRGPIRNERPNFAGPFPDRPEFRGPIPNERPEFRGPIPNERPEFRGPIPERPEFRGPLFRGPIFSQVPKFHGPVVDSAKHGPRMIPVNLPRNIRIQTNPVNLVPKDIMTPPKPVARISQPKVLPIAGPPSFISASEPAPRFDPNGRRGDVKEINVDAEMIVGGSDTPSTPPQEPPTSQQPPKVINSTPQNPNLKHHLLVVN